MVIPRKMLVKPQQKYHRGMPCLTSFNCFNTHIWSNIFGFFLGVPTWFLNHPLWRQMGSWHLNKTQQADDVLTVPTVPTVPTDGLFEGRNWPTRQAINWWLSVCLLLMKNLHVCRLAVCAQSIMSLLSQYSWYLFWFVRNVRMFVVKCPNIFWKILRIRCMSAIIWVCLKMGYTPNYSHLVGIVIINHWV